MTHELDHRVTTGLRPFRPGGYRVALERLGDGRPVVHNYGHGGAGITLSWGTAERAADLVRGCGARTAAVLGAGAVGLATARILQESGLDVTVYAREMPLETTSVVAGALWAPFSLYGEACCTSDTARCLTRACEQSRLRFDLLDRQRYGLRDIPLWSVGAGPLMWEMAVSGTFHGVDGDPRRDGIARDRGLVDEGGLLIDPTIYLPALLADLRSAGGQVARRDIGHRSDLDAIPGDVVVNCTGLGARALFDDESLMPIKGQLVHLPPDPEVRAMVIDDSAGVYVFPRPTSLVLGGSFVPGDWSLAPDPAVTARILDATAALVPALRQP
jgi:D-amino-acid oxidase